MDWVKDTGGLLQWVSPFRNLRIDGYLPLPEAYRSLSRLSSALSAKASTIRSYQHNQPASSHGLGSQRHTSSVMCVGNRFIFTGLLHSVKAQLFGFVFFELLMFFNITSDVLIKDIMLLELLMSKKILFNHVTLLLISCNVTLSLYAVFKVHGPVSCLIRLPPDKSFFRLTVLSVITYTKWFVYLITGKPSYCNSTALLIGLAWNPLGSCAPCQYLCLKT